MSLSQELNHLKDRMSNSEKMPLLFIGHGSPMNAIEDTMYNRT